MAASPSADAAAKNYESALNLYDLAKLLSLFGKRLSGNLLSNIGSKNSLSDVSGKPAFFILKYV